MNNQTLEKLRLMHLFGMHDAFKTSLENTLKEQMTQDQFVFHLVSSEWDNRRNRAIERVIKQANFRYNASLEEVDYTFERADLLILDDFGMQAFDSQGRGIMMDIIEDRHQKRSTLITSQVPVKNWHGIIGEKTVADAILDRLVHHSLRVELFDESIRKRKTKSENAYE